jgi:triose-phosphate isomerase
MVVFTPLTLYLAIANPVSDCGCFGDAVKLTNWQTFWKNVPLLLASIFLLLEQRTQLTLHKPSCLKCKLMCNVFFPVLLALFALFPSFIATVDLPMIDFRPYRIGANLQEGMVIPEGAPQDEYQTEFVYEKDGVQKKFTEFDYPWDDSTWHYVSSKNILLQKGYEPPIHDFALETLTGENKIGELLATDSMLRVLVVTPFLETLHDEDIARLNALQTQLTANGMQLFHGTAASQDLQEELYKRGLQTTLYTTNERTLKTIVRASTGVVLIRNAVVLNKWRLSATPIPAYFSAALASQSDEALMGNGGTAIVWGMAIVLLLVAIGKVLVWYRRSSVCGANQSPN